MLRFVFRWLFASAFLFFALSLTAQTGPQVESPELEADTQDFDAAKGQLTASGRVELTHGGLLIQSDTLVIDQVNTVARASGNVRITRPPFRITANEASYNYRTGAFEARGVRLGAQPFFFEGESATGTLDALEFEKGTLHYGQPDSFGLNIVGKRFRVEGQEQLTIESATFRVGDVPWFYLPSYEQDLRQDSPVYYSGALGSRPELGFYWQNDLRVRVSQAFKIGGNADLFTSRGLLAGPGGSYQFGGQRRFLHGEVSSGLIDDWGSPGQVGTDDLGDPIDPLRHFVAFRQIGATGDGLDHAVAIDWWSDTEILRDFRQDLFLTNQKPDNHFSLAWRASNWTVAAVVRPRINDAIEATERLPGIEARLHPSTLSGSLAHRAVFGASRLREADILGNRPAREGNRVNAYYGWLWPVAPVGGVLLTPYAGGLIRHYNGSRPGDSSGTLVAGEMGLEARMTFSAVHDVESAVWKIDGLRHTVSPVLQAHFVDSGTFGASTSPEIDRQPAFASLPGPLSLADSNQLDIVSDASVVRAGFENELDTRDPDYGSRSLARLDVFQDFHVQRSVVQRDSFTAAAPERVDTLGDIHTQLTISPAYWLVNEIYTRLNPDTLGFDQISSRTRFIDGDQWSLSLGSDFIRDIPSRPVVNQYSISPEFRINSRNRLMAEWRVDAEIGKLTEQTYGWETTIGNALALEVRFSLYDGAAREGDFNIALRGRLLTF